jgi:hypothetical protein
MHQVGTKSATGSSAPRGGLSSRGEARVEGLFARRESHVVAVDVDEQTKVRLEVLGAPLPHELGVPTHHPGRCSPTWRHLHVDDGYSSLLAQGAQESLRATVLTEDTDTESTHVPGGSTASLGPPSRTRA